VLPVYPGELQCRALGAKVEAFDEHGRPQVGRLGELVVTEPLPADLAVPRERGHLVHEALRCADASCRDHHPFEAEPLVGEGHALAVCADEVRHGHPDVSERNDRVVVGDVVHVRRRADYRDTVRRQVDDQQHMLVGRQLRLHEAVIGDVVRRHVPLDAVDDVLVAVALGRGLDRVHVGPCELLGDRIALVPLATRRRHEPALPLVVGRDVRPPRRRRAHDPCDAVRNAPDLLLHEHLLEHRVARAAY
jgi:hypothetical protein